MISNTNINHSTTSTTTNTNSDNININSSNRNNNSSIERIPKISNILNINKINDSNSVDLVTINKSNNIINTNISINNQNINTNLNLNLNLNDIQMKINRINKNNPILINDPPTNQLKLDYKDQNRPLNITSSIDMYKSEVNTKSIINANITVINEVDLSNKRIKKKPKIIEEN
jgi:hypothetical protein